MKFLLVVIIGFLITSKVLGVDTNISRVVVFRKTAADGRTLEVIRKSTPFSMPEVPDGPVTNYYHYEIKLPDLHWELVSNTSPYISYISQSKTLPDRMDTFSVAVLDGTNEIISAGCDLVKVHAGLWDEVEFYDVAVETNAVAYLYKESRPHAAHYLFVNLAGPATVTNIDSNPSGINHSPMPQELSKVRDSAIKERMMWTDHWLTSRSVGVAAGTFKSARILGSYLGKTLAIEVTTDQGVYTNKFVDEKWE
jgi:hypothetical protein